MIFHILSWAGVACLTAAHVMFAGGASKRSSSIVSALGAGLCMVAAAGLGIWAVTALNAAWICISLSGARVIETYRRSRARDLAALAIGPLVVWVWLLGPDAVSWAASAIYLSAWWMFSTGRASRREYLIACIMAGGALVPALLMLEGHAYAANEYLGMMIGLTGVWRGRCAIHGENSQQCV